MAQIVPAPPPRAPRRHRRLIVLIVVVVVLLGLVIGGDQVARVAVQAVASNRVQSRIQTPNPPTVTFDGWPFLLQVARSRYQAVHVVGADALVSVSGQTVAVSSLDATAYDVVATNGYQQITAARGEITALLPYDSVSRLTGLQVSSAGDGKIKTTFAVTVNGTQISGTASGRPSLDVDGQRLSFTDVSVSVGNAANVTLADAAGQIALAPIPLSEVPFGLRLTAVEARDNGIVVSATGTNLPLRQ